MGMFFGESGRAARAYGIGPYEEIEDAYSRLENSNEYKYEPDENKEENDHE